MMVLDIVEGEASDNSQATGTTWFNRVRETWFCPVVVYSAFPDRWNFPQHPFVEEIKKGADTDEKVLAKLEEFAPTAKAIRAVHQDFDARVREALRDSVHALNGQIEASAAEQARGLTLVRVVRRIVAARVDVGAAGDARLHPWERYVIPPLGPHLLTADLLMRTDAEWRDADAFRLVLTPSCDLVPRGASTNVGRILVARCERLNKLGNIELKYGEDLPSKQQGKLRPLLTEGMAGSRVPIPEFENHLPLMAADLKKLELLKWSQVQLRPTDEASCSQDPLYRRVASTDSPFREMVTWAYVRVAGRPGIPEIDVDRWIEDISSHLKVTEHEGD